MRYRSCLVGLVCFCLSVPLSAQISRDAKYDILRTVVAEQAAARIALPFGEDGVELTDVGEINKDKLEKDIRKNGQSIEAGKVVTVTAIAFDDDKIDIELDGGGKNKKNFLDRIQVGIGSTSAPISRDDKTQKAKGSKIVLRFAQKVPGALTPMQLKDLLDPVLDFNKHNFMKTGIDALPPEFQEAVKAKEARIGMDRSTVIMALGRPNKKFWDSKDGVNSEQWLYYQRGYKALFVTFENNVVVEIKQY